MTTQKFVNDTYQAGASNTTILSHHQGLPAGMA
jgi:hypothetical protein